MTLIGIVKNLSYSQLFSLGLIFLKKPYYIIPTILATKRGIQIAVKAFPETHGGNQKGNAFRHGIWSSLIVFELCRWGVNLNKAKCFSEKITTWHEAFSPNEPLAQAMDLHNNYVGIQIASGLLSKSPKARQEDLVRLVFSNLELVHKIHDKEEVESLAGFFVHLDS